MDIIKSIIKKFIMFGKKLLFIVQNLIFAPIYANYLFNSNIDIKHKKNYIPDTDKHFERKETDTKLIAFYLPQYHTIPLNDKYHGKGFTDWKNVVSAIPQFIGHYQPHVPADCGFYDLSNPKVLENQSEIAQKYGIYGFCYHYYWFSGGKRLLEKPIFDMLNNQNVTIPFCLCWANENWSKLWDGGNKKIIMEQKFKEEDFEKFFYDILPFFKDKRYIKINNKPLLVIYRSNFFNKDFFIKFIDKIKSLAKKNGFDDLKILSTNAFRFYDNPKDWNLYGTVEFPPHGMKKNGIQLCLDTFLKYTNKNFNCFIWDMKDYIKNKKYLINVDYPLFKGIFPSWDNTARKAYSFGEVYKNFTPELYKIWLKDCIKYTKETKLKEEQFVFINAWNEWAEGAHLEADLKYGYTYLNATREVLEELQE